METLIKKPQNKEKSLWSRGQKINGTNYLEFIIIGYEKNIQEKVNKLTFNKCPNNF